MPITTSPTHILVTYATRTGSTKAIAETIEAVLAEAGCATTLLPVQEVVDLSPYRAAVIGSAIQNNAWLPEAIQFIQTHRNALLAMPVAAYLVCMTLATKMGPKFTQGVPEWKAPARRILEPVSEGYFPGRLSLKEIPSYSDRLKFRISIAMGVWDEGQHEDWEAVQRWAAALPPLLKILN